MFNPSISASTNRINLDQDGDSVNDYAFDAAGNTTNDAQLRKFTYDAENKQTKVETVNSSGTVTGTIGEYFYDGDGRRVKKIAYSNNQVTETTVFVYDASSRLVAEYSTILNRTPQVAYLTADHLGSPRINTNELGAAISRHDYRPYGEEVAERTHAQYVGDTIRQQFTGYERDGETDLDFAQARMFSDNLGRFTTIDPLLSTGEPGDPQTWHRYAYALNNPLDYTDPSGMYVCNSKDKRQCDQFAERLSEAKANLVQIEKTYTKDSEEYKKAAAAVAAYGEDETGKKTNNGVFVVFDLKEKRGHVTAHFDSSGKLDSSITVHLRPDLLESPDYQEAVAHEGSHVNQYKTVGSTNKFQGEFDAQLVSSVFSEVISPDSQFERQTSDGKTHYLWNPSWNGPEKATLRDQAIRDYLAVPTKLGGYGLTPPVSKSAQPVPKRRRKRR